MSDTASITPRSHWRHQRTGRRVCVASSISGRVTYTTENGRVYVCACEAFARRYRPESDGLAAREVSQ